MKSRKLIIILLIIQIALTWVFMSEGVIKLSKYFSFLEMLGLITLVPLMNMVGPIISGIFAFWCNEKRVFGYVSKISFYIVSGSNILILLFLTVLVFLDNGNYTWKGMLSLVSSILLFYIFLGSIILGIIVYYVKWRFHPS